MVNIQPLCVHNDVNEKTMKVNIMCLNEEQIVRKQFVFKLQNELFNMSKVKCQRTLGFFNFTETICHRGEEFNVKIPDKAKDNSKTCSL